MSSDEGSGNAYPYNDDVNEHDNNAALQFDALNSPDDNKNGHHVHYFPSGDLYKGEWLNNKMHGKGILTLNVDKEITSSTVLVLFQGEFEHGLPVYGRAEYADGSVFDGDLKDGLSDGHGVYTKGGLSVTGDFSMGQPQGQVTVIFQDGDDMTSYNGELHQSYLHGQRGMIRFPQTSTIASFEGDFEHNLRTSWGVLAFRPPASTLLVAMDGDKIDQMVSEPKKAAHTSLDIAYRYDGFNYIPGSNIFLSPHYHTHTQTLNHHPIKKVFGQFESDRLIFGTIYYSDNSVYTGYLLAGTQTPNGTFIPTPTITDPREVNPFAPRENVISRYGFGIMYHHIGNNVGTVTIADWNMDLPHGQVIVMYNYGQHSNPNATSWSQEIEFQQDFDELSTESTNTKKQSHHLIFQREIIAKGEAAVIEYLQQQCHLQPANTTNNDEEKAHVVDPEQPQSTITSTTYQLQYLCDALYAGHMQRGIRHDMGLFLTLTRYSRQVDNALSLNDPNFNCPPILSNNEVDAYFGLFEDDLPHNQGSMVFLPSQQPNLTSGLTQLDVSWDYVNYFKTNFNFDMVAFHQFKHELYKKRAVLNDLNTPTAIIPTTLSSTLSSIKNSNTDVNEDISLTYYRGQFFYSCRNFGLSLYTTATTESNQPETLFYGSHHSPTNDILARAKSRNHCQDISSYLHSDLYRNNLGYREHYLTRSDTGFHPTNTPTTPSSKRIDLSPRNSPDDEAPVVEPELDENGNPIDKSNNIDYDLVDTSLPGANDTTLKSRLTQPDRYANRRHFTAQTAHLVRGDSAYSGCLSLPNLGVLFYFSPNVKLHAKKLNESQSESSSIDDEQTPLNDKEGPYKKVSLWFGAVTTTLQRHGHGCLCLNINMSQFISLHPQQQQQPNSQQFKSSAQHSALSALKKHSQHNNNNHNRNQQQLLSWMGGNYHDPLNHPLILYLMQDQSSHAQGFASISQSTIFSASSTSAGSALLQGGSTTGSRDKQQNNNNNNNNSNQNINSQNAQQQVLKLFNCEKITTAANTKIFSFFLFDLTFFGTIMTPTMVWQGPIATVPLPEADGLDGFRTSVNNNTLSNTIAADLTSSPITPTPSTQFFTIFKHFLLYITILAEQHVTGISNRSLTDLIGTQQSNKMVDENFARAVQRFAPTSPSNNPFISVDVKTILSFLNQVRTHLITKDSTASLVFETLRFHLLSASLLAHQSDGQGKSQKPTLRPCCPQISQFFPYGTGEIRYLPRQHLDTELNSGTITINERFTGFVLLSPMEFIPTTQFDSTNLKQISFVKLKNDSNPAVLNKYLDGVGTIHDALVEHETIHQKLDQFQSDAVVNLGHLAQHLTTITDHSTSQGLISTFQSFNNLFSSLKHPAHEIDSKGRALTLPPQALLQRENELFLTTISSLPLNPLDPALSIPTPTRFTLINVLLDGALSSAHSPNIFMGHLVDVSPKLSLVSPTSIHHITDQLAMLPFSHGHGIITAGNLSQNKTYGKFHLGLIMEGIEIDDTGDVFIGPYVTVVKDDGEKIQQKHGRYVVVLTLRKWVVVCNYDFGKVVDGKVYYNVAQHVLQEVVALKSNQVADFELEKFIDHLYVNRRALARKMTKTEKNGSDPNGSSSSLHVSQSKNLSLSHSVMGDDGDSVAVVNNDDADDDEKEDEEDFFALGYDPKVTDITQLHGYLPYYTCTTDDTDKALEVLYEDELVSLLHATTEPPALEEETKDDEKSNGNKKKNNSDKTFVRVTADGLVCFDQYSSSDPTQTQDLNSSTTSLSDPSNSQHNHLYSSQLPSDQVRTTRCFRYRLPNPDAIGQLSRLFYTGGLDDGFLPDGTGELTWSTPTTRRELTPQQHFAANLSPETAPCETYTGDFQHGVLHGKGKVTYHTPVDYALVDFNAPTHVSSSFLCPCVLSFEGTFQVGSPVKGIVQFDPKSFSQGQTYHEYRGYLNAMGEFQGEGLLTYSNGHKFRGQFEHSRPVNGALTFANGLVYTGPMHCPALQDSLLDPFYLMVQKKLNQLVSNQSPQHQQQIGVNALPGGFDTYKTGGGGKNDTNGDELCDEHVALGNTFAFSHFVLFSQLCNFISSYYQAYASAPQSAPVVEEVDEYGNVTTTLSGEEEQQYNSSGYCDVPLPLQLSLFSPLFTDVTRQYEEYQQEQQQKKADESGPSSPSIKPTKNDDGNITEPLELVRPSSSSSASSSSTPTHESPQQTSLFDLRTRLQALMVRLKELNALHTVSETTTKNQVTTRGRIFLPISSEVHQSSENLVDGGVDIEAHHRDIQEKYLETDIIQYVYDLKSLTSELYPPLELRPTTTDIIPIEQQQQLAAMYILLQGRLTVVSLSQISRLFGSGVITFTDQTTYDESTSGPGNFVDRCKDIINKTVTLCLSNTRETIKELTGISNDPDYRSWPVLPLPSSIAIQHQFEQRQKRIQKHTTSLTLSIHSNINTDQFTSQREHQQYTVSSTSYKSRINDTVVKGLSELQQIVMTEATQRGSIGQSIDSLNSFLDESSSSDDEDDFDPTIDLETLHKRKEEKKLAKVAKREERRTAIEKRRVETAALEAAASAVPSGPNDNNQFLPSFIVPSSPNRTNTNFNDNKDKKAIKKANSPQITRTRSPATNRGIITSSSGMEIELQFDPVCDSYEYVQSKIRQLRATKDIITSKLAKLSKMLKVEENDYQACCQRFGRDQFEQQDAKAVTGPIWSQHAATKMLFDKQIEMLEMINHKNDMILKEPQYSADIFTIIDTNIDVWELFLLRKEILLEERLRVFFLLTKLTLAFKHRRLLLVLLLHALSKNDVFITLIDSNSSTQTPDFLKQLLAPTRTIFGHIGNTNQMITDLKSKLKSTLIGLFKTTVPTTQQVQKEFINGVLQTAIMEFTGLRSKLNSTTSEFESITVALNQTLETTTKVLEARHRQRKQLSQVLFVEELQQHIYKNDLLSTYALIYATNYHPKAQEQLLSRKTKDHPLDLSQPSQQTYLTPVQLACVLGLSHMVVLLHKLGCSLQQKTLCAYAQMTKEQLKERDTIQRQNSDKEALHRLTLERAMPEVISNKTIVELIIDSKHYDMLGVLHHLKFAFDGVKATVVQSSLDKDSGDPIIKHIIRPLLHHYIIKCDSTAVKYLLLLGMDPNVCDTSDNNMNALMVACKTFSQVCYKQAKLGKSTQTEKKSVDRFASSSYEDTASFGVAITQQSALSDEELLQQRVENAMETVHILVQYGAKLACKDDLDNTILHHLFSSFYDQGSDGKNTQPLFPIPLKQLSSWLAGHGARYRELRNKKNQPAYLHQQLCTEFDTLRNAYIVQSQQFHYNFNPLNSTDQRWQNDDNCLQCTDCLVEFGLFTRKHHCRCCGYIYCDQCSKITINNNSIKCCVSCYNKMHMLTLPRDRRKEQLAAQQRAAKLPRSQGSSPQSNSSNPTDDKASIAATTYNYAQDFLPQFILEFHTELATAKPQLISSWFEKRGLCWFLPQVAKITIRGFDLAPNMAMTTIDKIITKNDTLLLGLRQLDNRHNAPQTTPIIQQQQQQRPGMTTNQQLSPQQQQQQQRPQGGVPPPQGAKLAAPPPPSGGANKLAAPPPPAVNKLSAPPPPSGTNKLAALPPTSSPTATTPLPPSQGKLPAPRQPVSGGPAIDLSQPTPDEQSSPSYMIRPHPGLIGRFTTQLEEEKINLLVEQLLEQVGASISVNIQKDKMTSGNNQGGDFVLVHVLGSTQNNGDCDNLGVVSNKKPKARNPLEDDDDDDLMSGKNPLTFATKIQASPLDDHFHSVDKDDDDLFG